MTSPEIEYCSVCPISSSFSGYSLKNIPSFVCEIQKIKTILDYSRVKIAADARRQGMIRVDRVCFVSPVSMDSLGYLVWPMREEREKRDRLNV